MPGLFFQCKIYTWLCAQVLKPSALPVRTTTRLVSLHLTGQRSSAHPHQNQLELSLIDGPRRTYVNFTKTDWERYAEACDEYFAYAYFEWKLPFGGRITYRHCRQPKIPNFLFSSSTTSWRLTRRANNNNE